MRFELDLTDSQQRHLIRLITWACYIFIAFYLITALYLVSGFWANPGGFTAMIFQFIIQLGGIALVYLVWSRDYPLAVRGSVLVLGTLLFTPHAFDYDLTLLVLPLAWFAGANLQKNRLTPDTLVFFLIWLSPMINREAVHLAGLQVEPIILACFMAYLVIQGSRGHPRLAF